MLGLIQQNKFIKIQRFSSLLKKLFGARRDGAQFNVFS